MWDRMRWFGTGCLGVAVVLAWGRPSLGQAPQAGNPNVYVNPFAAGARFPGAAAVGQPQNAGGGGGRIGYGALAPGAAGADGGYGSLSASYANPSMGYGSLMNSNNNNSSGNGYSGGYGIYGTQWMQNPYQGYLSGAADITRANAEYYQTIQQARLTREEARRSSLQTRRALIEEIEWEREHMPDPEKIRQKALERELSRARVGPPLNDIWAARSLNALLRHLIAQQGQGGKGPTVALNEEMLDRINVRIGNTRGNVGLLKNGGQLRWPLPLMREPFKEAREKLNELLIIAYKSADRGVRPDSGTISELRANYKKLAEALDANVNRMSFNDSLEAKRYLNHVKSTIDALKDANVLNFFTKNWKANAHNVAELVRFMSDKGLEFAEATPTDEAAYVALYHALVAYDHGMQRVASVGGEGDR
jgi:hypothetical protein